MNRSLNSMATAIGEAEKRLAREYSDSLVVNQALDRKLVSFQANKNAGEHRWCKYREAFSADLMRYLFREVGMDRGKVLDPFAGSGTALFVASELGLDSLGIELLPCSAEIIEVRQALRYADSPKVASAIQDFCNSRVWERNGEKKPFQHLRITAGAFSEETEKHLGRYLYEAESISDPTVKRVLRFAAMCILESISFTRKDGQYLRWDWRSGRRGGKTRFDKGTIRSFSAAMIDKLSEIASDLTGNHPSQRFLFGTHPPPDRPGEVELLRGTCLEHLPRIKGRTISGIVTSPPYCNRYDYTRTYALELAYLGVGEDSIKELRQAMVSCTVENRDKTGLPSLLSRGIYAKARKAWEEQRMLQIVLEYLDACRRQGELNNNGIARMVKNYFLEMSMVIFECARILRPGRPLVMVNDNVRYQGAHLPVDLILSDFAQAAGLDVETIWVLPRGKGNSSQQMARHGRQELRKCVYVWRKRSQKDRLPAKTKPGSAVAFPLALEVNEPAAGPATNP